MFRLNRDQTSEIIPAPGFADPQNKSSDIVRESISIPSEDLKLPVTSISAIKSDTYILNYCSRAISRHNGATTDGWRIPVIDSFYDEKVPEVSYMFNAVTFIYSCPKPIPKQVALIGDFTNFYEPIPLRRIKGTPYFATTLVIPKGEVHRYKYSVEGSLVLDPINPQTMEDYSGSVWSQFFTHLCRVRLTLTRREFEVLDLLVSYILPFRTEEAQRILAYVCDKSPTSYQVYKLYMSAGVGNYIDKILTKEERHRAEDYRYALYLIDEILCHRHKSDDTSLWTSAETKKLFSELASNTVPKWNYEKYISSSAFLRLLRRHTFSGAFSHPKYGGNAAAIGWSFLEQRYIDSSGNSLFNWKKSIEYPLGLDREYHG